MQQYAYGSPAQVNLQPGSAVSYHDRQGYIVKRLGQGSFGEVYAIKEQAADQTSELTRALKILKLWLMEPAARQRVIQRFQREFECGQISSPYLVSTHFDGELNGNPFIIMDYCSNGPLDKWLEKNRLANAEIEERLVEILRGLQALHQRGITHRDLKPANVLIDNQKRCRVTDFGIAGMANSRITQRQQFNIGTPLYIAPEQMQQNLAFKYMGPVADMFSFGVMAFELFSGEYPFMYRQQLQKPSDITLYQEYKRQGQYFPIHQFCPDLPEHWQQLIEACLHPSPDHRLHSAVDAINHIGFAAVDSEVEGEGRSTAEVQLVVMRGFAQGQRVDLYEYLQDLQTPCLLQLGRTDPGVNNHIDLPDEPDAPTISRQHATLEYASGPQCWYIRDGQFDGGDWKLSTNGTQVNGRHVGSNGASLHVGDIITLGETTLRVELAQLPHWMAST